jgi:hypothetical protein
VSVSSQPLIAVVRPSDLLRRSVRLKWLSRGSGGTLSRWASRTSSHFQKVSFRRQPLIAVVRQQDASAVAGVLSTQLAADILKMGESYLAARFKSTRFSAVDLQYDKARMHLGRTQYLTEEVAQRLGKSYLASLVRK